MDAPFAIQRYHVSRNDHCRTRDYSQLLQLAKEYGRGQEGALDGIWNICANDLLNLALWRTGSMDDAEDVVQEVFMRLAENPRKLGRISKPRAYLLRMARNVAVDIMRKRRRTSCIDNEPFLIAQEEDVASVVDAEKVTTMLRRLPPRQREVLFLRHFAGLTFREVSLVCRVPLFTAASRYRIGVRRLRKLLGVDQ